MAFLLLHNYTDFIVFPGKIVNKKKIRRSQHGNGEKYGIKEVIRQSVQHWWQHPCESDRRSTKDRGHWDW